LNERAQLFEVDLFVAIEVVSDHTGNRLAPALTFLNRFKPVLELNALFFERQVKQTVGRSDGDQATAQGIEELRAATTLNSSDTFIFGCAGQGNPPCQETEFLSAAVPDDSA
jgi:hypothetical protein